MKTNKDGHAPGAVLSFAEVQKLMHAKPEKPKPKPATAKAEKPKPEAAKAD